MAPLLFRHPNPSYPSACSPPLPPCSRQHHLPLLKKTLHRRPPSTSQVYKWGTLLCWQQSRMMPVVCSQEDYTKKSSTGMISQLELENAEVPTRRRKPVNAIYWLLLINLGIFVADRFFMLNSIQALYLYHDWPRWYQFITATFCHLNWNHLSGNLFFLYIFGKLVEEEEGGLALWISYLVTGAGANLVSWLFLPRTVVSAGSSGAVFGLFAISVLVKISWNWRKILEVFILGQFVIEKVMEAAQASAQMAGQIHTSFSNVNHVAHLSGALMGVALIWVLSHVPSGEHAAEISQRKTPLKK